MSPDIVKCLWEWYNPSENHCTISYYLSVCHRNLEYPFQNSLNKTDLLFLIWINTERKNSLALNQLSPSSPSFPAEEMLTNYNTSTCSPEEGKTFLWFLDSHFSQQSFCNSFSSEWPTNWRLQMWIFVSHFYLINLSWFSSPFFNLLPLFIFPVRFSVTSFSCFLF